MADRAGSESLFAVRRSHVAASIFGVEKEPREYVEHLVISAGSIEEASDIAIGRSSVAAIRAGLTVEIVPVSFERADWRVHASYDGEPLTGSHASTGARRIVRPA